MRDRNGQEGAERKPDIMYIRHVGLPAFYSDSMFSGANCRKQLELAYVHAFFVHSLVRFGCFSSLTRWAWRCRSLGGRFRFPCSSGDGKRASSAAWSFWETWGGEGFRVHGFLAFQVTESRVWLVFAKFSAFWPLLVAFGVLPGRSWACVFASWVPSDV